MPVFDIMSIINIFCMNNKIILNKCYAYMGYVISRHIKENIKIEK